MLKPLKDLIAEADRYLGQTKVAASAVSDEVSSLADTLTFATQIEEQFAMDQTASSEEFEKVAKALNKIAAAAEIEVMTQSAQFEKTALEHGYTSDQINEALTKVAAQKIHKNLANLTAIGMLSPSKEDLNSLTPKKKVKAIGEEKRVVPLTKALRGAM